MDEHIERSIVDDNLNDFVSLFGKTRGVLTMEECLHSAVSSASVEVATYLAESGADLESRQNDSTPLEQAVEANEHGIVEMLLANGANPNAYYKDTWKTPMTVAASCLYLTILKTLVRYGGLINDPENSTEIPLNIVCGSRTSTQDAVVIASYLLDNGADIERRADDSRMYTPLEAALMPLRSDVVKLLIDRGASLTSRDSSGNTPLMVACAFGGHEHARILIENGADMYATNDTNRGVLFVMSFRGQKAETKHVIDVLNVLLEHGYDLETRDANGYTSLMQFAIKGASEVVQALVDAGAKVNAVDSRGQTALTHAARGLVGEDEVKKHFLEDTGEMQRWNCAKILASHKGNSEEAYRRFPALNRYRVGGNRAYYDEMSKDLHAQIDSPDTVAQLILNGADVDRVYFDDEYTPLMRACARRGGLHTAEVLLNAGASIDKPGIYGYTPIIIASSRGNTDTLELLLSRGVDVSSKARSIRRMHGINSLMAACIEGHLKTAEILVDAGIDLDETDAKGNTALHSSVENGHEDIVDLLIKKNAAVNTVNYHGVSPLHVATFMQHLEIADKHLEIADKLVQAGAKTDQATWNVTKRLKRMLFGRPFSTSEFDLNSNPFNTTFKGFDLTEASPVSANTVRSCESIDYVRLEDGRCVHQNTKAARYAMMKHLNSVVDPDKFVLPIQISGTCWFFTAISVLFVSDGTRKNTLSLRRAMIMGRKSVNESKFSAPLANALVALNVMIQTMLNGDRGNASIYPILQNEDIVLKLRDAGMIPELGLNSGALLVPEFYVPLLNTLDTDTVSIGAEQTYVQGKQPRVIVTKFKPGMKFHEVFHTRRYVADSVALSGGFGNTGGWHVVAGITLNGNRCIHDSTNGRMDFDWITLFFQNDKSFEVFGMSMSSKNMIVCYVLNERR